MDIQIRDEWDGTQTLLLDGEVVLERKAKEVIEERKRYLECYFKLQRTEAKLQAAESTVSRYQFPEGGFTTTGEMGQ
jgi:hypothetical protein